jgi:hypothetical protein
VLHAFALEALDELLGATRHLVGLAHGYFPPRPKG